MSSNEFFAIGVNIFRTDEVQTILLKRSRTDVEVRFIDGKIAVITLEEGATLPDYISLNKLNSKSAVPPETVKCRHEKSDSAEPKTSDTSPAKDQFTVQSDAENLMIVEGEEKTVIRISEITALHSHRHELDIFAGGKHFRFNDKNYPDLFENVCGDITNFKLKNL